MSIMAQANRQFDTGAAVTRSLLGWGVVAGPFYLVVGLVLALTRPGFDLTRHPLSLLMLGDGGWLQITNIVLSGVMVLAAALGFARATTRTAGGLLGAYGAGLVLSGIFPPNPMNGFPVGAAQTGTFSGVMHLVGGAVGFLALSAAAFAAGGWFARRGDRTAALYSRTSGAVVVLAFISGAALSVVPAGVALLWLAVVAGWAWLLVASVRAYRTVPHPDCAAA
jgi:Protein of unknown function (DUF998)